MFYVCWYYSSENWVQMYRWIGRTYNTGGCINGRPDKDVNNTIPKSCLLEGNDLQIRTHLQIPRGYSGWSTTSGLNQIRQYENELIIPVSKAKQITYKVIGTSGEIKGKWGLSSDNKDGLIIGDKILGGVVSC